MSSADLPLAMLYPACFNSRGEYVEWHKAARLAQEPCSPCDDCTPQYRSLMRIQDRCDPQQVQVEFFFGKRRIAA